MGKRSDSAANRCERIGLLTILQARILTPLCYAMHASRLVIALLLVNLACQSNSRQGTETAATAPGADSAALLTKRPGPDAPRSAADRLVRALYFEHNKTENPFRQPKDRALIDQFFAKPTADLIWHDIQQPTGKLKPATRNPLFDAPDKTIHKTWVEPAAVAGSRAVVYVTFLKSDKPEEIRLDLEQVAGRWRITEMHYPDSTQLTHRLQP